MLPPLLQIGDVILSTDIISEYFACDYDVCKGVCCIEGDSGAPMNILPDMDETAVLSSEYGLYADMLSDEGRKVLSGSGFSMRDREGDLVTPLLPGGGECAFCHKDRSKGLLCAIEMAGRTKPLSCSLYPVRVKILSSGLIALNLHRWNICRCAFEKGRKEGTRVYEFLKKPLIKAFGQDFYEALEIARREFEGV